MTEKRFILCNKTTDSNVWDTLEKQYYSWEYVVYLLNELNEENQRLKNDCSILVQSNQEYRKENEQLLKELKGLNRKYIAFSEATDKRLKEMMR